MWPIDIEVTPPWTSGKGRGWVRSGRCTSIGETYQWAGRRRERNERANSKAWKVPTLNWWKTSGKSPPKSRFLVQQEAEIQSIGAFPLTSYNISLSLPVIPLISHDGSTHVCDSCFVVRTYFLSIGNCSAGIWPKKDECYGGNRLHLRIWLFGMG